MTEGRARRAGRLGSTSRTFRGAAPRPAGFRPVAAPAAVRCSPGSAPDHRGRCFSRSSYSLRLIALPPEAGATCRRRWVAGAPSRRGDRRGPCCVATSVPRSDRRLRRRRRRAVGLGVSQFFDYHGRRRGRPELRRARSARRPPLRLPAGRPRAAPTSGPAAGRRRRRGPDHRRLPRPAAPGRGGRVRLRRCSASRSRWRSTCRRDSTPAGRACAFNGTRGRAPRRDSGPRCACSRGPDPLRRPARPLLSRRGARRRAGGRREPARGRRSARRTRSRGDLTRPADRVMREPPRQRRETLLDRWRARPRPAMLGVVPVHRHLPPDAARRPGPEAISASDQHGYATLVLASSH